jgi:intracellular sulfur oxidation DsrE/DsrF family protein
LQIAARLPGAEINKDTKQRVAKHGKMPELTIGVKVVPAGVTRIMELQEQGYAYVRP